MHDSDSKEVEFIHTELANQVQAGHVVVFPLETITPLQNLWLSPVEVNLQVGRRPRLIFDFTWSGLNNIAESLSPMEAMRFGGALLHILKQVLTADLRLGPVYLSKVELAYDYMRLWVSMEDFPSAALLIPKKSPSNTQLVGFHISLPMGYINSAPCFCVATGTVADLANEAISQRKQAGEHPLKLTSEIRAADDASASKTKADAIK